MTACVSIDALANDIQMSSVVLGSSITIVSKGIPPGTYSLSDPVDAVRAGYMSSPSVSPMSPISPALLATVVGGLYLANLKVFQNAGSRSFNNTVAKGESGSQGGEYETG